MIVVPLTGPTAADVRRQVRSAARHADLFELRLDMIRKRDRPVAMRAATRPWVATCRTAAEGGKHRGRFDDRAKVLRSAIAAGASYVDIELHEFHAMASRLRIPSGVRTIASLHVPARIVRHQAGSTAGFAQRAPP